ncbi:hypothetical protein AMTR_s00131p00053340 [Amborella trichopoda]|uniref:Uncharacterized protein n=1 Tax=Amborella trichopoda TaxID=13333 RepID=W1NVW9_AMBTC|nr:hypothetical protein AMTR_s00131p00053340 [Amborella trichopoda]
MVPLLYSSAATTAKEEDTKYYDSPSLCITSMRCFPKLSRRMVVISSMAGSIALGLPVARIVAIVMAIGTGSWMLLMGACGEHSDGER